MWVSTLCLIHPGCSTCHPAPCCCAWEAPTWETPMALPKARQHFFKAVSLQNSGNPCRLPL